MDIQLIPYQGETETAVDLIIYFWQAHNQITPSYDDALADLDDWTRPGHRFYFIHSENQLLGFVHLGSRGCETDWLEDIFVLPPYQGKGIGRQAIQLAEQIVKQYSECMYIEVAARNRKALRLYRRIGYDCLNTLTIRKDFRPEKYETVSKESVQDMDFDIKIYKG